MKKYRRAYVVPCLFGDVEVDYTIRDDTLPRLKDRWVHPNPQHWHEIVKAAKDRDGWRCVNCNGDMDLQGHHRTYVRWGREIVEDVYILCDACHVAFHQNRRLAG